jgi:hypothetical protein
MISNIRKNPAFFEGIMFKVQFVRHRRHCLPPFESVRWHAVWKLCIIFSDIPLLYTNIFQCFVCLRVSFLRAYILKDQLQKKLNLTKMEPLRVEILMKLIHTI